jgi:DNA-binding response OmpR family regulator
MNALVVDDEEDIGLMVSKILQKEGYQTDYVGNVKEARNKMEKMHYTIYFLDLKLPDGSGFDLIPKIREYKKKSRVIIISAHNGFAEKKKAKELEVDEFIPKPFTKSDIIETLPLSP